MNLTRVRPMLSYFLFFIIVSKIKGTTADVEVCHLCDIYSSNCSEDKHKCLCKEGFVYQEPVLNTSMGQINHHACAKYQTKNIGGLPCDPDYCNNNAECVTGKQGIRCVCEENQTQVIEHRCAKKDHCKFKDCGPNAYCSLDYEKHTCHCLLGYEFKGGLCADTDECHTQLHKCDLAISTCNNTEGSYECVCLEGYAPSPYQPYCIDADECSANRNVCSSEDGSLKCFNTMGTYWCVCNEGFQVKNELCVDINECERHDKLRCNPDTSRCINTHGSYMCQCSKEGFEYVESKMNCADKRPDHSFFIVLLVLSSLILLLTLYLTYERSFKKEKNNKYTRPKGLRLKIRLHGKKYPESIFG